MGIERFFNSVQQNSIANLKSSFTKILEKQLDTDELYMDFNSVVYVTRNRVVMSLNYLLFKVIKNEHKNSKRCSNIIKEFWINDKISSDQLTAERLHQEYNEDLLDELIIYKVLEYVVGVCTNYVVSDKLKLLYIAIDGVPNKSKMVEQKNRRYLGVFAEEAGRLILEKHSKELKKNADRWMFQKYRINWSRGKITPGTPFMHRMNTALTSSSFEVKLKKRCVNLKKYVYSGPYEPGEGEEKIVDALRGRVKNENRPQKYVIYSPDSDVTLLGLILNSRLRKDGPRVTELKIIRHNQQKDVYDVVDVDLLASNLFSYMASKIKTRLDKDAVVKDLVFVLTVFGNDFVPKLESYSAKYDFSKIIDVYVDVLSGGDNNDGEYLINSGDGNKRTINQSFLVKLLEVMHQDEGGKLQKMYVTNHYKNYRRLEKIFGEERFNANMIDFLDKLRRFNESVKSNNTKRFEDDKDFLNRLQKLTKLSNQEVSNSEFVKLYKKYYSDINKLPKVAVTFQRYQKSLDDRFHMQKLERSLEHMNSSVTEYDKEMYRLNSMLDEYTTRLQATPVDIGRVSVDYKNYVWSAEKIVDGVKRYYRDYFDIKDIDVTHKPMKMLIETYVDGLIWVFEHYFNNFDAAENYKSASSWFYHYDKAPLLTQIFRFMKSVDSNYLSRRTEMLKRYQVARPRYFNCLEHLMYVSPAPFVQNLIPKEYVDFANKQLGKFYPDLKETARDVIVNKKHGLVDCRGVLFMSKCKLKAVDVNRSFDDDARFIGELRKIKLGFDSKERLGEYRGGVSRVDIFEYGDMVALSKLKK